ncbi:hypothetical protein L7F22_061252 [Adiantum nelumboides]|nr:hypothetical protein [Adiantum nelumboides]
MEPGSAAKNKANFEDSLKLLLHHSRRLQERPNGEGPDVGMDKLLEGQWPCVLDEWANSNMQSCDSPLASDSSSSRSTRDSSLFSWSEGHVLHSPEMLSSRFSGFSLFNPGVNNIEWACRDSCFCELTTGRDDKQSGYDLHEANMSCKWLSSACDGNIGEPRSPDFRYKMDDLIKNGQRNEVMEHLDGGWVSDSSDLESLASLSSEELQRSDSGKDDADLECNRLCGKHQQPLLMSFCPKEPLQAEVGCLKRVQQRYDLSKNYLGTNENQNSMETCHNVSYGHSLKDRTVNVGGIHKCDSTLLENNDIECASINKSIENSGVMGLEKSSLGAPHQLSSAICFEKCRKGNGTQVEAVSETVDSVGKPLHGSHKRSLPTSVNTLVPNFLQSVGAREPRSHRRASYSAAVKERFASSTMHGYLRFAEQGGSPCYTFFLDDSDEVIFARASKQERKSNKENCEWTYLFHSKLKDTGKARGAWKNWSRKENLASKLVAYMRVSGVGHLKAKTTLGGRAKGACFVLYDACGSQHQAESQKAGTCSKMRGQPLTPVFENTSNPQAWPSKEGSKPCCSYQDAKAETVNVARLTKGSESRSDCSQQAELAAIVISTTLKEKKNKKKESQVSQKDASGWGIKFLEKGTSGWGLSLMDGLSSNTKGLEEMADQRASRRQGPSDCVMGDMSACGGAQVRPNFEKDKSPSRFSSDLVQKLAKRMNTRMNRLKVDVTVVLPAGDHGLPNSDEDDAGGVPGESGPTPLLERWMSGGDCDCGGWDVGCGLSVYKAETLSLSRTSNIALTRNDRLNWLSSGSSFKLITQGYRCKRVLVLDIIEAGLFSLSFQARVSPLQAFAIAVALFHQQMSDK